MLLCAAHTGLRCAEAGLRMPEGEQYGIPLQPSKACAQSSQALHHARKRIAGHQVQLRLPLLMVPAPTAAGELLPCVV